MRAAAIRAALFHTWRFDMPSSNDAMSAALGAMRRSRTREPSDVSSGDGDAISRRSSAIVSWSSQIDSMYVLKKGRDGPSTLSAFG